MCPPSPHPPAFRHTNIRSVIDERLLTNSNSALHLACGNGRMETVKVLLAASAAVNAGNSYGNAPIHAALMGGHRAVRASRTFQILKKITAARVVRFWTSCLVSFYEAQAGLRYGSSDRRRFRTNCRLLRCCCCCPSQGASSGLFCIRSEVAFFSYSTRKQSKVVTTPTLHTTAMMVTRAQRSSSCC